MNFTLNEENEYNQDWDLVTEQSEEETTEQILVARHKTNSSKGIDNIHVPKIQNDEAAAREGIVEVNFCVDAC